jgi:hypothetical protein
MASIPEFPHAYSSELSVSSATLDRFGRRNDDGLTSTVAEYMRNSGFVIEVTQPTGLGGGGFIEFKVTAGMIVSVVKALGAAARWAVDAVRKKQQAKLNTRLPPVWIQFSAKHQGGGVPLPDAGLLVGIIVVLPGLLSHLDEKFPNRQFIFGGVSNWYEAPADASHSRRIVFEIAGADLSPGRLLRMAQILEDNLTHSEVIVRLVRTRKWLPRKVKIQKSKTLCGQDDKTSQSLPAVGAPM